jgi:hypothetical protein
MLLQTVVTLMGFMSRVIASRINGAYMKTPFFVSPEGLPRTEIYVLSESERKRAYSDA